MPYITFPVCPFIEKKPILDPEKLCSRIIFSIFFSLFGYYFYFIFKVNFY